MATMATMLPKRPQGTGALAPLLSEDVVRVLVAAAANPLEPQPVVSFSATCHFVHTAVAGEVGRLREQHLAVRDMCRRAGICAERSPSRLEALWLRNHWLAAQDEALVALFVRHSAKLQLLTGPRNQVGDAGAASLGKALRSAHTLRMLDLSVNRVGDTGAAVIAEVLKKHTHLQLLYLKHNLIGDVGAAAIGLALTTNKGLTVVDVAGNLICDEGASSIGEGLGLNETLQMLFLDRNQIGDVGATALAGGLRVNKALRTLSLFGNRVGRETQRALLGGGDVRLAKGLRGPRT